MNKPDKPRKQRIESSREGMAFLIPTVPCGSAHHGFPHGSMGTSNIQGYLKELGYGK